MSLFFSYEVAHDPIVSLFFNLKKKNNNRKEKSYKLHIQPMGLEPITLPSIPLLR